MARQTYTPQARANLAWSLLTGLPPSQMLRPWDETDSTYECESATFRFLYIQFNQVGYIWAFPAMVQWFNDSFPLK